MSQIAIIQNLTKKKETALAILFEQINLDGQTVEADWIPDNEILYRHKDPDNLWTIHIPVWLAKKKSFDYEEKD